MKTEIFQITINGEIFSFRKLSALGLMKRTGLPIGEEGQVTTAQDATKLAPMILEACSTNPSSLDALSFMELSQLMSNEQFMSYLENVMGKMDAPIDEAAKN